MQTTVNGRVVGYDERGEGTPLVLIHGYPLNRMIWEAQWEGLDKNARSSPPTCAVLANPKRWQDLPKFQTMPMISANYWMRSACINLPSSRDSRWAAMSLWHISAAIPSTSRHADSLQHQIHRRHPGRQSGTRQKYRHRQRKGRRCHRRGLYAQSPVPQDLHLKPRSGLTGQENYRERFRPRHDGVRSHARPPRFHGPLA